MARIIRTHADVLEGLFAFVSGERRLTAGYIKELHAALLREQETVVVFDQFNRAFEKILEKGKYKSMPNNPTGPDGLVHQFCPPEHVSSEIDRMLELHDRHVEKGVAEVVEAAWLHHVFTQVHPFQDGNGRVARSLARLILIKGGFFPFVVGRDDRERYIVALETADGGDLSSLVRFVSLTQKRSLAKAIGQTIETKSYSTVEDAVAATRDLLVNLGKIIPAEYLAAKTRAGELSNVSIDLLNSLSHSLTNNISGVDSKYRFTTGVLTNESISDLRVIARQLQYDPIRISTIPAQF